MRRPKIIRRTALSPLPPCPRPQASLRSKRAPRSLHRRLLHGPQPRHSLRPRGPVHQTKTRAGTKPGAARAASDRFARSRTKPIQVTNIRGGNARPASLGGPVSFAFFFPQLSQFPRVQPVTAAVWTLIHFHPALGTVEMTMQSYFRTARTISLPRRVHQQRSVQRPGRPGLTPDRRRAHHRRHLRQQVVGVEACQALIEASWAFHKSRLP